MTAWAALNLRVARLTFRALALAVLATFIVGWMVSYLGLLVAGYSPAGDGSVNLMSAYGRLTLNIVDQSALQNRLPPSERRGWLLGFEQRSPLFREAFGDFRAFRFYFRETDYLRFSVAAPYWFLTTLAAMGAALSLKRSWRFTTRQLLLATTAIAALLAAAFLQMRG